MATGTPKGQVLPSGPPLDFNPVFLVWLLVCGVLTLLFLFYFNRLFGKLVAYAFRAYTWHTYRVYVDVQALQISLLAGRIFFKGFRYHGDNETILIHSGYLTWRYWLRRVRDAECTRPRLKQNTSHGPSGRKGTNTGTSDENATSDSRAEKGGVQGSSELPCRLVGNFQGLEWYVYNRSAAYDAVVASMSAGADGGVRRQETGVSHEGGVGKGESPLQAAVRNKDDSSTATSSGSHVQRHGHRRKHMASDQKDEPSPTAADEVAETSDGSKKSPPKGPGGVTDLLTDTTQSTLLKFFPIRFDCHKGAIILGNKSTRTILTTKFEDGSAQIDATHAQSLDQYKQIFDLDLSHPVVQLSPNASFGESTLSSGSGTGPGNDRAASVSVSRRRPDGVRALLRRLKTKIRTLGPFWHRSSKSVADAHEKTQPWGAAAGDGTDDEWIGLSRYLVEGQQKEPRRWESVEYAQFATVLDSPRVHARLYWDVPGSVPPPRGAVPLGTGHGIPEAVADINGDTPPEWGLDLRIGGGSINYGPWADRQRTELQAVFFPRLCTDAVPAEALRPGDTRTSTVFKLFVEVEDDLSLRTPSREESKDWKWNNQAAKATDEHGRRKDRTKKKSARNKKGEKPENSAEDRPFGWLDIRIKSDSTISYTTAMVADQDGYGTKLDLELCAPEISSSVNHGLLLRTEHANVSCDLSSPLQWNSLRTWTFDITSKGTEIFLLRDHIFLMTDLVTDWGSGPPSDYHLFVPYKYVLKFTVAGFKFHFNVNDNNIINNPSEFDDNAFLTIHGMNLVADVIIPLDRFRPLRSEVSFGVDAHHGGLDLYTPLWNTQATFLDSRKVALLQHLFVGGRYNYFAATASHLTDTLELEVRGHTLSADLYGFLIRYILKIKDNYLGDDIHFKTLEEYQELLTRKSENPEAAGEVLFNPRKTNDLDVILTLRVEECSLMLPANLYSAKDHIRLDMEYLDTELRFTSYYMDLRVDLSPMSVFLGAVADGEKQRIGARSNAQAFVDGVTIYGHRLFGLPPAEPTYVCNWDIELGSITGECSSDFLRTLSFSLRNFGFNFDDDENALPLLTPIVLDDVTFLRLRIQPIRTWIHVDRAAVLFTSDAISLDFNDWAAPDYSAVMTLKIPVLTLACIDAESTRHQRSRAAVKPQAFARTAVSLTMINRKAGATKKRMLQQRHIRLHDQRTGRTKFLLAEPEQIPSVVRAANDRRGMDPPAMPFPPMPEPVRFNGSSTTGTSIRSTSSQRSGAVGDGFARKVSSLMLQGSRNSSSASVIRSKPQSPFPISEGGARSRSRSLAPPILSRHSELSMQSLISPGRPTSGMSQSPGRMNEMERVFGAPCEPLSSSFITPQFPLLDVNLDAGLKQDISEGPRADAGPDSCGLPPITAESPPDDSGHTRFFVRMGSGVEAFTNVEALFTVAHLLETLQPTRAVEVLDALQISAINQIFDLEKQKATKGNSTDLMLHIPHANIRVTAVKTPASKAVSSPIDDEYQISLSRLRIALRSRLSTLPDGSSERDDKLLALHTSLSSAAFSVRERCGSSNVARAALNGSLEDLVFWVVADTAVSANARFGDLEIAMQSSEVDCLASMIDNAAKHGEEIGRAFSVLSKLSIDRLQDLAAFITTVGSHVADPSFMTRPSYLLRSANDHLRVSESWKIVSRLRHMYESLPMAQKAESKARTHDQMGGASIETMRRVVESFDRWRNWELARVDKILAMREILGSHDDKDNSSEGQLTPIRASLVTEDMRLLIDPGPKQSELSSGELTAGVVIEARESSDTGGTAKETFKAIAVSVNSNSVTLRLDWELCEMVEKMLKLQSAAGQEASQTKVVKKASASTATSPPIPCQYHVLANLDVVSIILDGINLKSISVSKGLKASVVLSQHASELPASQLNALLHTDAASTELVSHSRVITMSRIVNPSIYFMHEIEQRSDHTVNIWKLAGKCQDIRYEVEEELLGLMEAIDLVVIDEVPQIQRLLKNIPAKAPSGESSLAQKEPKDVHHIRVALLLDEYHVTVALLHSLKYVISGNVARISLSPSREGASVFDFDLKEHSHKVETRTEASTHSISVLDMPPINGRVVARMKPNETVLEAFTTIESIVLDAAAIHNLFDTMNRPEITNVLREIRADLRTIVKHVKALESSTEKSTEASLRDRKTDKGGDAAKALVYLAHLTVAGVGIHASAPGEGADAESAHLDFTLGCVQIKATNRLETRGPTLKYPELHLGLGHIGFELARTRDTVTQPCGNLQFGAYLSCSSARNATNEIVRAYHLQSDAVEINLFAETASTVVGVISHLQDRIKDVDLSKEVQYLKRLRKPKALITNDSPDTEKEPQPEDDQPTRLFGAMYSVDVHNIQVGWIVGSADATASGRETEDLVLSFKRIDLATSRDNAARLTIENFQLQMVPTTHAKSERSLNSALLPEVIFKVAYLSTKNDRRLAFQAAGKSLDMRMTSQSMLAANAVQRSIAEASAKFRAASASWHAMPTQSGEGRRKLLGNKRLGSLLVDADFAGAVVYLQGSRAPDSQKPAVSLLRGGRVPQHGRYGQFTHEDSGNSTTLRSPGVALKVEYQDNGKDDPSLKAELKVDASTNILYPTVVPLVMEMSSSIKEIVGDSEDRQPADRPADKPSKPKAASQKFLDEDSLLKGDPSTMLGRCRLNVGLRICRQEFSLSCQPIARVAATAKFEDIYITINTVRTTEHEHFLAISGAFTRLQASVQHVYSRESTGNFDIDSIVVSLMNSKHVSGVSGISTILKMGPMKAQINARQLQDFLLFREIWYPPEIRHASAPPPTTPTTDPQPYLVQRYQQVASAGAFPWNAAVSISEVDLQLDLGQALGKSAFMISNLWVSTKKSSDWEQNLCMGFDRVGIDSVGRMSGFVELVRFGLRTSIQWPSRQKALNETPLIQASIGFGHLRIKAAFDYQAFLVADVTAFDFVMYNVREERRAKGDRLVAILDGDKVQVYCTTTSAAQAIALYQAFIRLAQEKRTAYEASLKDIEKFLRRKSMASAPTASPDKEPAHEKVGDEDNLAEVPSFLQTDVVLTLRAVNVGAFPSTFHDNQVLELEASDAQARFAVSTDEGKLHSHLGLALGQLRIALSAVARPASYKPGGDVNVEDVVHNATSSRGGTILRVPRVLATMQTWQTPGTYHIDYIFTSSFEGKVDVGWNYSRISFIRAMWAGHSRALAQRLGKPLPQSAVRITGGPQPDANADAQGGGDGEGGAETSSSTAARKGEQKKITAVVDVPLSKYDYTALEPAIIETPQLRDMGEATPPLEWIGLNRERLPNLTHQIVIVTLLEIAREVEDAYSKILGSS